MKRPEQSIHKSISDYLKLVLPKHVFVTTIDHAGGGYTVGKFRKIRGAVKGLPDLLLIFNGWCFWIEIKSEGGKLQPEQKQCHEAITLAGSKVAVCRSIDDVAQSLADWGIPSRHARLAA